MKQSIIGEGVATFDAWVDPRGAALALADERQPKDDEWVRVRGGSHWDAAMRLVEHAVLGKRPVGSVVLVRTRRGSGEARFVVEVQEAELVTWSAPGHSAPDSWWSIPWVSVYRFAQRRGDVAGGDPLCSIIKQRLAPLYARRLALSDVGVHASLGGKVLRELLTEFSVEQWEAASRVPARKASRVPARKRADEALETSGEVPYAKGLPLLRLRRVCAQWENGQVLSDGSVQVETFSNVGTPQEVVEAPGWPDALLVAEAHFNGTPYRPHGQTWEEVEAKARALEESEARERSLQPREEATMSTKEPEAPGEVYGGLLAAYREGKEARARQDREKQADVEAAAGRVLTILPDRLRLGLGVVEVSEASYSGASTTPSGVARELNRRMGLAPESGWQGDAALPGVCISLKVLAAALEARERVALASEWSDEDLARMAPREVTSVLVRAFCAEYHLGLTEAREALDARRGVELLALEYAHRKGTGTEDRAPLWTRWRKLREAMV